VPGNHREYGGTEKSPSERNLLLESILPATSEALGDHFDLVLHQSRRALPVIRGKPGWVHFPIRGAFSVLRPAGREGGIEAALIGTRDMTGFPWQIDEESWRAISIIPHDGARSLRISAECLELLLQETVGAQERLIRYLGESWLKLAINLSCLRNHAIDERLSRWLLNMLDHYPGSEVKVTQQLLAQLLGVRRGAISAAASCLQIRGLIRYSRGVIRVVNRRALSEAACDCWRMHRQIGIKRAAGPATGAKLFRLGENS
jgi:CRP-like cAMP-binding protein